MYLTYRDLANYISSLDEELLDNDVTLVIRDGEKSFEAYQVQHFVEPALETSEGYVNGEMMNDSQKKEFGVEEIDDGVLDKGHPYLFLPLYREGD